MKILSAQQLREADQYTIIKEGIKSSDLMERAACSCFEWISNRFYLSNTHFRIFCGPGNNGGDGLVIARHLLAKSKQIEVYILKGAEKYSKDFIVNENRIKKENKKVLHYIQSVKDVPRLTKNDCVIDALFGTGLNKPVTGLAAQVIDKINKSTATVVSIDLPSGLFADMTSPADNAIVKANYTITFQCPKQAFLFAENHPYVGMFIIADISLDRTFIKNISATKIYLEQDLIRPLLIERKKFDHKGTHGHALLIAGSYGKMGAAVLASRACLRAGAGLLTTHAPQCGYKILQTAAPEVMVQCDADEKHFTNELKTNGYAAVGIGPGLSTKDKTARALKHLVQHTIRPMVLDADALNLLAENKALLKKLPANSILTPHPKEFERLAGVAANDFERHQLQLDFAIKNNVYVILKGAHTCIACPDGTAYFNSTGNPGMATAGSGDVLTGILTGLLAQGYSSLHAALVGVYIHGLAGDLAAKQKTMHSLIASDIIEALPKAYKELNAE